jgi:hypothetical protein
MASESALKRSGWRKSRKAPLAALRRLQHLVRALAHFDGIANAFLRAFKNGFRDKIADRVGAAGKTELDGDLVEHKTHEVDVFLVEWRVLKDAIG